MQKIKKSDESPDWTTLSGFFYFPKKEGLCATEEQTQDGGKRTAGTQPKAV